MASTLHAIAKKAGVSHMTVSRVLNNKDGGRVSPETRERVLATARDEGYRPNRAAQALVTGGKTRTIALWVRDLSSAYSGRIAACADRVCSADGYEVIVRSTGADRSRLAEWPVDGILAFDSEVDDRLGSPIFSDDDPAFVSADVYINREYDHVYLDVETATREAVLHLAAQGCRRIAHVGSAQKFHNDSRWNGYLAGVEIAGTRPELISLERDYRASVAGPVAEYLAREGMPDGFVCRNDDIAIGLYVYLRRRGVRIPDDVCLVGCDGMPDAEYLDVPISTIFSPVERVCETAWEFLKNRMADPTVARQSATVTSELRVRASSQRKATGQGE